MFKILWIEDEVKWVNQLAPVLAAMPGISLTVLLLSPKATEIQIDGVRLEVCDPEGTLNMEQFWELVLEVYGQVQPWLIITDLKLPVSPAWKLTTKLGEIDAAGIPLTRLLFEKTSCRNVIWLTNYGSDVVRMPTFVVKDWDQGGVNIISFPQTFVVNKIKITEHVPALIAYLTNQLIEEIRTSLNYRIEAPRIAGLLRLLSSDSVEHFFTKPAGLESLAFEETKQKLGTYDLIPYHDPPVTFGAWLRALDPNGPGLESIRKEDKLREFAGHLTEVLGNSMWGMEVSELPEFLRYSSREHKTNEDLLDLDQIINCTGAIPEDVVIGPVARSLLVGAVGNSLQNAQQHGRAGTKIFTAHRLTSQAIYLMIASEVDDFKRAYNEMSDRVSNKRLRGINLVCSSIDGLNQLHEYQQSSDPGFEGWGLWGYVTVGWNNEEKKSISLEAMTVKIGGKRKPIKMKKEANHSEESIPFLGAVICWVRVRVLKTGYQSCVRASVRFGTPQE